jgi:hypothetical protein
LIDDRRPGLGGYNYSLQETKAKIYLTCDSGVTAMAAWKALQADGAKDIELEDVKGFLDEMTELRLMYEEDGLYLSLAVHVDLPAKSGVVEAKDALAHKPDLVKLCRAS